MRHATGAAPPEGLILHHRTVCELDTTSFPPQTTALTFKWPNKTMQTNHPLFLRLKASMHLPMLSRQLFTQNGAAQRAACTTPIKAPSMHLPSDNRLQAHSLAIDSNVHRNLSPEAQRAKANACCGS